MGFLNRIFGYKKVQEETVEKSSVASERVVSRNENVIKLLELKNYMVSLMDTDRYIAKSDYLENIKEYKSAIDFFMF